MKRRLIAFLYDLMRDHLPVGVVEKLVREQEKPGIVSYVYTTKELEAIATGMAQRLTARPGGMGFGGMERKIEEEDNEFMERQHVRIVELEEALVYVQDQLKLAMREINSRKIVGDQLTPAEATIQQLVYCSEILKHGRKDGDR